ncbi:MAG TPA: phosphomannomutase [Candidatus Paceibacterota bacterium]
MLPDKIFSPLRFGTSGIRAAVKDMTDMECYINTRGFIRHLYKVSEIKPGANIALAGDLRLSTPSIMASVHKAILDEGCETVFCGFIPTPTLSYYAWKRHFPSIMVTGSHIPEELNGIKFIKSSEEVLKTDEADILSNVALVREEEYLKSENESLFDANGSFKQLVNLPSASEEENALSEFQKRYTDIFSPDVLAGKKIVIYEQSAVGSFLLKKIMESLGAEVICFGKSDKFIPIDTEKMPDTVIDLLKQLAKEFKPFAIFSTDGDSDRPILADENGSFLSGDLLGTLTALYLKPEFASIPVTSNDAAVTTLRKAKIEVALTKVGSPYCIASMKEQLAKKPDAKVMSWEKNGGFLLGSDINLNNKTLDMLPTRDSILPLLIAVIFCQEEGVSLSSLVNSKLPRRFTTANAVDNKTTGCESYTAELGKKIINSFSLKDAIIQELNFTDKGPETVPFFSDADTVKKAGVIKASLESYFNSSLGYNPIASINYIDGVRITFSNGDVAHLRPSSNAPEFRIYITADTEERARKIIEDRFIILPKMISDVV